MTLDRTSKKRGTGLVLALSLFGALPLVAGLGGCDAIQGRESSGQYVDDATISTKVRAQLLGDQKLKAFDIHVDTMNDVVQLSGFVDSVAQKQQAEEIARGVKGVRAVRNNIVARAQ